MQYRKMLHTLLSYITGREKSIDNLMAVGDWRFIQLGNYTSASPLAIAQGVTQKITFQQSDISYTEGEGLLINYNYPSQKFMPAIVGDVFQAEIRMKVKNGKQNGHFDLLVECPTVSYNPVQAATLGVPKAANTEQFISVNVPIFIGLDIKTNGLEIKINAIDGALSVYDVSFMIVRLSSGLKP